MKQKGILENSVFSGMFTDSHENDQPAGTYRYALNAVQGSLDGDQNALSCEPSNRLLDYELVESNILEGYKPAGHIVLPNGIVLVFASTLNDEESPVHSVIYSINSNTNKVKILVSDREVENGAKLRFDPDYLVQAVSRIKNNAYIVYWTDGRVPPRFYDFGTDKQLNDEERKVHEIKDANKLNLFQTNYILPRIGDLEVVENGGVLRPGSYNIAIQYIDENMFPTAWCLISHTINVYKSQLDDYYPSIEGEMMVDNMRQIGFTETRKGIRVNITEIDSAMPFYRIALIEATNGTGLVNRVRSTGNISTNNKSFVLTGNNTPYDIELDTLNQVVDSVETAGAIAQINNRLLLANVVKQNTDYSKLQESASKITVDCIVQKRQQGMMNADSNKHPLVNSYSASFMPGETYAFGIVYVFSDGTYSPVFHIPGKTGLSNDKRNTCHAGSNGELKNGQKLIGNNGKEITNENYRIVPMDVQDEKNTFGTYGDVSGNFGKHCGNDLSELPIRHHKFPIRNHIYKYLDKNKKFKDAKKWSGMVEEGKALNEDIASIDSNVSFIIFGYGIPLITTYSVKADAFLKTDGDFIHEAIATMVDTTNHHHDINCKLIRSTIEVKKDISDEFEPYTEDPFKYVAVNKNKPNENYVSLGYNTIFAKNEDLHDFSINKNNEFFLKEASKYAEKGPSYDGGDVEEIGLYSHEETYDKIVSFLKGKKSIPDDYKSVKMNRYDGISIKGDKPKGTYTHYNRTFLESDEKKVSTTGIVRLKLEFDIEYKILFNYSCLSSFFEKMTGRSSYYESAEYHPADSYISTYVEFIDDKEKFRIAAHFGNIEGYSKLFIGGQRSVSCRITDFDRCGQGTFYIQPSENCIFFRTSLPIEHFHLNLLLECFPNKNYLENGWVYPEGKISDFEHKSDLAGYYRNDNVYSFSEKRRFRLGDILRTDAGEDTNYDNNREFYHNTHRNIKYISSKEMASFLDEKVSNAVKRFSEYYSAVQAKLTVIKGYHVIPSFRRYELPHKKVTFYVYLNGKDGFEKLLDSNGEETGLGIYVKYSDNINNNPNEVTCGQVSNNIKKDSLKLIQTLPIYPYFSNIEKPNVNLKGKKIIGYHIVRLPRLDEDTTIVDTAVRFPTLKVRYNPKHFIHHGKKDLRDDAFRAKKNDFLIAGNFVPNISPSQAFVGYKKNYKLANIFFKNNLMYDTTSYSIIFPLLLFKGIGSELSFNVKFNTVKTLGSYLYTKVLLTGFSVQDVADGTSYQKDVHETADDDGIDLYVQQRNVFLKFDSTTKSHHKNSNCSYAGYVPIDKINFLDPLEKKFLPERGEYIYNYSADSKLAVITTSANLLIKKDAVSTINEYLALCRSNVTPYIKWQTRPYIFMTNNFKKFPENGSDSFYMNCGGDIFISPLRFISTSFVDFFPTLREKKEVKKKKLSVWAKIGIGLVVVAGIVATVFTAGAASLAVTAAVAGVTSMISGSLITAAAEYEKAGIKQENIVNAYKQDWYAGGYAAFVDGLLNVFMFNQCYPYYDEEEKTVRYEYITDKTSTYASDDFIGWVAFIFRDLWFESRINMDMRYSLPMSTIKHPYPNVHEEIGSSMLSPYGGFNKKPRNQSERIIAAKLTKPDDDRQPSQISYRGHSLGEWYAVNPDFLRFNMERQAYCLPPNYKSVQQEEKFDRRIMYSDISFQEDKLDGYRNFRSNNYTDIDGSTGFITNLFTWNNRLYVQTEKALWYMPNNVQERITNDGLISIVGTGDFFNLQPQIVLDSNSHSGGCEHPESVTKTKYGVFFFSKADRAIYHFDGKQLNNICKRGIGSWFEQNWNMIDRYIGYSGHREDFFSVYDSRFERMLFLLVGSTQHEDVRFFASYSLRTNMWVSFHDYKPIYLIQFNDTFLSCEKDYMYVHDMKNDYLHFFDRENKSQFMVEVIFNMSNYTTVTWEDLSFRTIVYTYNFKNSSNILFDRIERAEKTFTKIAFRTSQEATEMLPLVASTGVTGQPYFGFSGHSGSDILLSTIKNDMANRHFDIARKENVWHLNSIRNQRDKLFRNTYDLKSTIIDLARNPMLSNDRYQDDWKSLEMLRDSFLSTTFVFIPDEKHNEQLIFYGCSATPIISER